MADLVKDSKTGYLFEGEMFIVDKNGRRGSGVSWRFSEFKKKLGFDGRYNFHCIRHSVATMLENSGVPYNVICHIMGWRDKSMLGTYGHGVTLATKREALEKAINFTK